MWLEEEKQKGKWALLLADIRRSRYEREASLPDLLIRTQLRLAGWQVH
jgi:hypothetical protein